MTQDFSVMLIGSGAREHTISKAYEKSPEVTRIIVAPGNDFIGYKRQKEVLIDKNCSLKDPYSILKVATKFKPDLVDVCQDDALASGTVDLLQKNGFQVFGPTKEAARIEWDKRWSREFMQRHQIPHPNFRYFDSKIDGINYVKELYEKKPDKIIYTKASGLCSGKGALKSTSLDEAIRNIDKMKSFANGAGNIFLIEDGLVGEEFSYHVIVDNSNYRLFKSAQDNKTVFDFDKGDQTGGMGAVSPTKVTDGISHEIEENQISKAINGMASEGIQYQGILYLGGIISNGKPINIEYNARWGDPECQVILPSLETDYLELVQACLSGSLDFQIKQDNKTRVCVVGASKGYPYYHSNVIGKRIYGLEEAMEMDGVTVFGAGIDVRNEKFYANGGRLFSVVGEGRDILEARKMAYSAIFKISVEDNNLHYRVDIGWKDVQRLIR